MGEMKFNETPVRTARNFNINNIKLSNIKYIENLKKFENIEIKNLGQDIKVDNKICDYCLKYGVSKELEKEVKHKANSRIKLDIQKQGDIQVINNFDNDNSSLVDDIEIIASEKSTSNILIKYKRHGR